jgi:hypothetical protein
VNKVHVSDYYVQLNGLEDSRPATTNSSSQLS